MLRGQKIIIALLVIAVGLITFSSFAQAQSPVVHAVMFFSPTCPHCKEVIEELLPALDQKYGSQLLIFGVNTYTEQGKALYESYLEVYEVPAEMQGVPALVVGDQYMVGSADIPARFPAIIDEGLEEGGIDWPPIPGLAETMENASNPENDDPPAISDKMTLKDKFMGDLAGNILSVLVLAGMLGAVTYAGINLNKPQVKSSKPYPAWLVPVLSLVGIGIAIYLAYVELNQVEAVCGPVGNCNTVQQSSYATLFGILPVGVLGVLGYIAILISWLAGLLDLARYNRLVKLAMWLFTLFGTLFSIYLTFLEPFVIGASCMWCLSSAVIMTILFLVATKQLNEPESAS
ncbi:MAG TPA: vitamin K epoxide reductase [Chloroflexi bacterium]|nr:vitamin K epoxide reductase [Chloroflexota bacterium]